MARTVSAVKRLFLFALFLFSTTALIAQTTAAPNVASHGVVNNASFGQVTSTLSPGTIIAIFGTNLDDGSINPFPAVTSDGKVAPTLGGASVALNGIPAPIFASTPGQIDVQIPYELSGATSATLIVTVAGQSSISQIVPLGAFSPGIFTASSDGKGQGIVQIANTAILVAPAGSVPGVQSRPALPGEFVTIYCTGLGDVTNAPATGALSPSDTLASTITKAQAAIGGIPAPVLYSGLAPGFAGLYQVNAQIPSGVASGDAVPLLISIGGVPSNVVSIAIAGPPAAVAPVISSSLAASGTAGGAFSYQITATNSPTNFGAIGLPVGLSLNGATGLISGTPTQSGTYTIGLSASNSAGTGFANLTLTIAPAGPPATAPPVISSAVTASGTAGSAFSYQITATNSPTNFGATGLPAGISLNAATGLISGTPTQSGAYPVGLSASNTGGTGLANLTLTIAPAVVSPPPAGPPVISSSLSASGTAGAAFSYQITATNSPTNFGAIGLPAGISLNAATGLISGTPTQPGTYPVGLSASNGGGTGSANLTLTIAPAVVSPPPTSLTGVWQGTYTSNSKTGGSISWTVTQTDTALSGPVSVGGGSCFTNGSLSGLFTGTSLNLTGVFPGNNSGTIVLFTGSFTATTMTGNYSTIGGSCAQDSGVWNMVKTN